jgi:hypothetical protein
MRQRLALVAVEQHDVASCGLLLAQLQAQPDAIHFAGDLASLQGVPGPPPTEVFFRNALDNCDWLICTPSRLTTSARRRAIVQFGRSATGSSSNGVITRRAAALFTGSGPGAMLVFHAATPPFASLAAPQPNCILAHSERLGDPRTGPARQRQQNGTRPIRFVTITRPRQRHQGNPLLVARHNLPPMTHPAESVPAANQNTHPLVKPSEPA